MINKHKSKFNRGLICTKVNFGSMFTEGAMTVFFYFDCILFVFCWCSGKDEAEAKRTFRASCTLSKKLKKKLLEEYTTEKLFTVFNKYTRGKSTL